MVRLRAQVTVSPATLVEVVFTPPVAQEVEVALSTEVRPQAAGDPCATEFGAAVADSPTWIERVESQEEELRAMSTSSEDDWAPARDPVPAPPRATPVVRPALQVRDVVLAVRSVVFLSDAQQLVPTMLSQFTTSLSASELSERVEWLWLMRRDVATYLRDNVLRGHLLQQSPEQILAELFQAMEMLSADLH